MPISPSLFIPIVNRLISARGRADVDAGVRTVIDACARAVPHPDWAAIRAIHWAADVPRLRSWVRETLAAEPPSEPLAGMYFACCQPVLPSGEATADLRFIGTREFSVDDPDQEWIFTRHYFPTSYAGSTALDELYGYAYRTHDWRHPVTGALANDAEWPVGLAFAVLATRAIVEDLTTEDVPTNALRIGIGAGWDEGDILLIGQVTAEGFVPNATDETR